GRKDWVAAGVGWERLDQRVAAERMEPDAARSDPATPNPGNGGPERRRKADGPACVHWYGRTQARAGSVRIHRTGNFTARRGADGPPSSGCSKHVSPPS